MDIRDFVSLIPKDSYAESLKSIQSITIKSDENLAIIHCHLSQKFNVEISIIGEFIINFSAPGVEPKKSIPRDLVMTLSKTIYAADEAISLGRAMSNTPNPLAKFILYSAPPAKMDLPTWHEPSQTWFDAEV